MKSYSLESYYGKINKNILLTESYTEQAGLSWIIRACRLKPVEDSGSKIVLHKEWKDEYGNVLSIIKNKRIEISLFDRNMPNDITTDLYYGLSYDKVSKLSKLLYVCYGQDDDDYSPMYFAAYLGVDNYLRCFMNLHGEWIRVSALMLGMNHLKNIFKNMDARYFLEFSNKEKMPFPCISGRAWLSYLPVSVEFYKLMELQHNAVAPLLNYNKGK